MAESDDDDCGLGDARFGTSGRRDASGECLTERTYFNTSLLTTKGRGPTVKHSRRDFIKAGSASLVYGSALLHGRELYAKTLKLPLGLQLYSVRELLPTDYDGTLKQIGALSYREVESAGYFNHSATEVKQAMENAKLNLVSAHYSSDDLRRQFDQI